MSTTNGAEVTVTAANQYIADFITNYFTPGTVPVKSMILDAGLLRTYLSNTNIQNVKFMLGERPIGTNEKTLTLIVAGYDADGNYVLTQDGMVLDHLAPCPHQCPTLGNAASDYIVI